LRSPSARCAGGSAIDPYAVLGLPRGATDEAEVRAAFRRVAKIYHPDVPGTGDLAKFQQAQEAAERLLTPGGNLLSSLGAQRTGNFDFLNWSPSNPQAATVSSSAARPERDFSGSRGDRVNVKECASRRSTDLRKTPKLKALTHSASEATLASVETILARHLGMPRDAVTANMPLEAVGFFLEGQGSIGTQQVAETAMALENEFGVELIRILVGTWVKIDMPNSVRTVGGLADFVESKMNS